MTPRKHAELIKAWADGAEIQVLAGDNTWVDTGSPQWLDYNEYRIKPVPKADFIRFGYVHFSHVSVKVTVTFSGETGEPKKVEIIK
jgi:hypothetical protein